MEKELKKLGEAIYWSAQKFNIWEFALRKRPAQRSGKANGLGESRSRSNTADSHLL